jgi:hypothetical protein
VTWGAFDPLWVEDYGLKELTASEQTVGLHVAMLKTYLAISAHRRIDEEDGIVLSGRELMAITGLSRPMIIGAVDALIDRGLLQKHSRDTSNTNRYLLQIKPDKFRKVPQDIVFANLHAIGNRGAVNLDALKIYVALLYLRGKERNAVTVSHKRLIGYTGARPERIKRAIEILAATGLVFVDRSARFRPELPHAPEYILLGDFAGDLPQKRIDPPSRSQAERRQMADTTNGTDGQTGATPF